VTKEQSKTAAIEKKKGKKESKLKNLSADEPLMKRHKRIGTILFL